MKAYLPLTQPTGFIAMMMMKRKNTSSENMGGEEKEGEQPPHLPFIDTPDYHGTDRRIVAPAGRRGVDAVHRYLPLYATIAGLVALLVGWGVSVGVARTQLAAKLDITVYQQAQREQITYDMRQDAERNVLRSDVKTMLDVITRIDTRVTQIYCEGKPSAACR